MDIKNYISENKDRFLEELFSLIRIPSISSQTEHKEDMIKCANRWKELILEAGADKCEVMPTKGNPVVYAERHINDKYPTVLVYGHYDVMPVDPIDEWNTKPFEPIIKNDVIWARGADDDKGQSFMQAKAFEYMNKTNQLKCNVKFMLEGEEEIGSSSLYDFCREHKEMLKADTIIVSDTSMIGADTPSITAGLRGLGYIEVKVTGPKADLHSGIYGGAVANPINILCKIIAQLQDENNHCTVPDFYKEVIELSDDERALMAKAPFDEKSYLQVTGSPSLYGEKGYSTIERTGIRPSFDICGIYGGYEGEGAKTIIPSFATAKISFRLVPDQDYEVIMKRVSDYILQIAPSCVKVEVTPLHGGYAYVSPMDLPSYKAAEKAFIRTYGKQPIPTRSGGSIPIVAGFEKILGIKSILMGFGLSSDAIHSPNENYPLKQFFNGIETIAYFYEEYANIMNK